MTSTQRKYFRLRTSFKECWKIGRALLDRGPGELWDFGKLKLLAFPKSLVDNTQGNNR